MAFPRQMIIPDSRTLSGERDLCKQPSAASAGSGAVLTKKELLDAVTQADPNRAQEKALVREVGPYDIEEPNYFYIRLAEILTGKRLNRISATTTSVQPLDG